MYETGRSADVDVSNVATRGDVIDVIVAVRQDLRDHPNSWENPTLDRFLDALAASLAGIESGYRNRGEALPEQPTWRLVAELLVTASGYE
jgi:hypothetical protein